MQNGDLAVIRESLEQGSGIRPRHIPHLDHSCTGISRSILRSMDRVACRMARFSSWNSSTPLRPPRSSNIWLDWVDYGNNTSTCAPRAGSITPQGRRAGEGN